MCGRAVVTSSPEDLREVFGLSETPVVTVSYNVPPSRPLPVVRAARAAAEGGSRERRLDMLPWGLVPPWAEDAKQGARLALARVETIATSRAFRDALRRRRCLVVVDAFYEWKREGKAPSQPYLLRRPDGGPLALAGLWERRVSRVGEVLETCAIVTQAATAAALAVHDRMPVVLEPGEWDRWLDPGVEAVDELLEPHAPNLVAFPVSPRVNDPRHDDRECLEESWPAQGSLF